METQQSNPDQQDNLSNWPGKTKEQVAADIAATKLRVEFRAAVPKDIVSHHSGSILANEDPEVPWDADLENKAREMYQSQGSPSSLTIEQIAELLRKCDFKYIPVANSTEANEMGNQVGEIFLGCVSKIFKNVCGSNDTSNFEMSEDQFVRFVQKFRTPAFYFGQRLRKYVSRGQVNETIELILRGCNVNSADGEGLSPLHYACEYNRKDMINIISAIVQGDFIVDGKDKYGWTPLHTACHHGNFDCVVLLVEKLHAKLEPQTQQGKMPMHIAAAQGRVQIAEYLVSKGADLNSICDNGMTPLHDAAFRGHKHVFAPLSHMNGIDLTVKDRLGYTPSDYMEGRVFGQ